MEYLDRRSNGSRKRKQPSPPSGNPFIGVSTRSKSQVFLHRHRSGLVRLETFASNGNRSHIQMTEKPAAKRRSLVLGEPFEVCSLSQASIKDLRTRRVFSPASPTEKDSFSDPFVSEKCVVKDDMDKDYVGLAEDSNDDNGNLDLSVDLCRSTVTNVFLSTICDRILNENGSDVRKKCLEMPMPVVEELEGKVKNNCVNLNGNTGNSSTDVDQRNGSISGKDLVSVSRSRRKVFKAPSSFSYRRLLPFLSNVQYEERYADEKKPIEKRKVENDFTQIVPGAKYFDSARRYSVSVEVNAGLSNVDKGRSGNFQKGVDDLIEEIIQTTPPDADIFSEPEDNKHMASNNDNSPHIEDHLQGKILSEVSSRIDDASEQKSNWRNNSMLHTKLVLNPCSRLKVFRTPSSISYRRLLPYLMAISNDNSCAPKTQECLEPKDSKVLPKPPLSASIHCDVPTSIESGEEGLSDDLTRNGTSILNDGVSDSYNSPNAMISKSCISDEKESDAMFSENSEDIPTSLELVINRTSEHRDYGSSASEVIETEFSKDENDSSLLFCTSANHDNSLSEGGASEALQNDMLIERTCISSQKIGQNDDRHSGTVYLNQSSSLVAADFLELHVSGTRKGILKKNPRGCRGICNCLNCASFRLHAERAFEFSKNQMQDAEEVAFELINKLAFLRNMLKEYADVFNDRTSIKSNQVEEVCMKALETEDLAKNRLRRMNDDLRIHCRITCVERPRVTFAGCPDEKVIPESDCRDESKV